MGAGLCESCRHARTVESRRGSVFLLCEAAQAGKGLAKYPRLPVLRCGAYAARVTSTEAP